MEFMFEDYRKERLEAWDSLSKEDQLMHFCTVCEKILLGEKMNGSYRYILYNIFGFDSGAYGLAQDAGFLELHNIIWPELPYTNKNVDLVKRVAELEGRLLHIANSAAPYGYIDRMARELLTNKEDATRA